MNYNFNCLNCNYSCNSKQNYEKHLTTQKHLKNANIFRCEDCNYTCNTFQNYEKHLDTYKHINAISNKNKPAFICKKCKYICYNQQRFNRHLETQRHIKQNVLHVCKTCKKIYKHKSSLHAHQNITGCTNELRQTIIDISKNIQQPKTIIQHNTMVNNTNNNNNNNNTFNLQIFLNETCKDAINLTEFIENIKISLMDLETVGNRGYVKGISNIIIKNLSNLD